MSSRTLTVPPSEAGQSLLGWLVARLSLPADEVRAMLRGRKVRVNGSPCSNPEWRLRAGQRVEVPTGASQGRKPPEGSQHRKPPEDSPPIRLAFVDAHLVVADKPTGLTTMRHAEEAAEFGRGRKFLPKTLADLLPPLVAAREGGPPYPVIAVHRIDKETSGLVVFARNRAAEQSLNEQFRAHTAERQYLAVVRGEAAEGRIESWIVRDRGDGRRGSGPAGEGQHAVTHVSVVERLGEFTLVSCRLETGRTHQVRIHLGEAGTPLCGERLYDRPLHGRPLPDGSGIERVALHAATLGVDHPATGRRMTWESPLPADMHGLLRRLRRQAGGG